MGSTSDAFLADRKRVNRYALGGAGTVTKLTTYLQPTGTSGSQTLKAVVYADSSGAPGALLASSNQVVFTSANAAGWYDFPLSSGLGLQPGNYWIGLISGATSRVAGFRYGFVSGVRDYNANTYTSGPSNPFGSRSTDSEQMSVYATYTPAAPPPAPTNTAVPTISGTPQVGHALSTSNGSWSGSPTSYAYQWERCDTNGANCTAINLAKSQSYTVASTDIGSTVVATVTATNSGGSSTASSAHTLPVQSASDSTPPTQPTGLTATAAGSSQINLSWTASTDNTAVVGYTVRRNGSVISNTNSTATTFSDTGLAASATYSYTVDAYDAAGNHSIQSSTASAATQAATGTQHYEYVFPAGAMDVYDMDNGMRLVKTVSLPGATDIRGAVASPSTHTLYVSYGGDGGSNGGGSMLAFNLLTNAIVWTRTYSSGVDSMAVTPDGKTIYLPIGEASPGSTWDVVDASTGNVTGSISGGTGPHNTIVSLNGKDVYMGGRNSSYLTVADTATNTVFRKIGPLKNGGVRPFTINGKETLAFTTATGFLGFQVSDITTGKVLYTVPITGSFPYSPGQAGPSSPSHGISLSPDEKELWVIDQPNSYVHVFDVSGLPASPPVQVANIPLTRSMTGSQAGCTYDCLREGWLQHTLDGRYVVVGDSGDIISTSTRRSVANLTPLYNSRVFLEVDWSNGVPVATSSRSGVGYVTH